MKIIIPMTGNGSRFAAAGYRELKPLIPVAGKPLIQWIVEGIFPGEKDFLFICRQEHLETISGMERLLMELAPAGRIWPVKDWVKKGPVYDVLRASEAIGEEEACIINYCDVYFSWDWAKMKKKIAARGCDGCIPCYTGFHPHLLVPENVFASCRTDAKGDLIEIREKYSFERDKTKGKHSAGMYYFKTGRLLKKYCGKLMEAGQDINGEYYASLPYNFMVQDGLKVWVPTEMDYFCQWGTPEDLEEFLYWYGCLKGAYEA